MFRNALLAASSPLIFAVIFSHVELKSENISHLASSPFMRKCLSNFSAVSKYPKYLSEAHVQKVTFSSIFFSSYMSTLALSAI
jgi:hypothetical protein